MNILGVEEIVKAFHSFTFALQHFISKVLHQQLVLNANVSIFFEVPKITPTTTMKKKIPS